MNNVSQKSLKLEGEKKFLLIAFSLEISKFPKQLKEVRKIKPSLKQA